MSHIERSEKIGRQGQQHKHHRWSGQDHLHNDHRAGVIQYCENLKASRHIPPEGKQNGYMAMLDGLKLEHMAQDCSSLKTQLLHLKALLQCEDTESPTDVPEESKDLTTALQMEELVKEMQVLRDELRSRDTTIAQLTLQCKQLQQHQWEQMSAHSRQVRCQCRLQRAPSSLRQSNKRVQHHSDKATQTAWRPPCQTPQILQPFNPGPSKHLHKGRPVKLPSTEGRSDLARSLAEEKTQTNTDCRHEQFMAGVSRPADPDDPSHLLSSQLHCLSFATPQRVNARHSPTSAAPSVAQPEWRAPAETGQNAVTPRIGGSTGRCLLQPPRLHKRASLPVLKSGGTGGFALLKPVGFSGPPANWTKQLPPPSRGLPCFNAGPQAQPQRLHHTLLLQPRTASEHRRGPRGTNSSLEESVQGTLKEPGSTKILLPLSHSCLPKPKVP